MKPKTSPIWKYFLEVNSCTALCITCNRQYSRKGRTTSALKSHLKSLHPELFEEFQRFDDAMKNDLIIKRNNAAPVPAVTKQIKKNISILTEHKKIHEQLKTLDNKSEVTGEKSLLREKNNVLSIRDISMTENNNEMWIETNDHASNNHMWTSDIKIELSNDDLDGDLKNERESDGKESPNLLKSTVEKEEGKEEGISHDNGLDIGHKRICIKDYAYDIAKRRKCMEEHKGFWESSNERSQEMDRLIGEMIAEQCLPFEFVESIGFRRVINAALPAYKLKNVEYFTTYICEDLYFKVRNKIKNILGTFEKITFTVDIVQLENGDESFVIVKALGIDEEYHKKSMVLKCEVLGEYTAQEIFVQFQCMLQEWDIEYRRVNCVIHDQGCMGVEEVYSNVNCVVHQVRRCVTKAMETEEWFQKLVKELFNINKHFENSVSAQKELKSIQTERLNQTFMSPLQETSDRWTSWYNIMEQFLKIKDSLSLYTYSQNITTISPEDWSNIERFAKLYKPINEITKELANANNSVSSVIPLFQVLINAIDIDKSATDTPDYFKSISNKLTVELNSILNNLKKSIHYTIATYLDPRYKAIFFNDKEISDVEAAIFDIISKNEDNGECNAKMHEDDTADRTSNETTSQLQVMLESILSANDSKLQQTTDIKVKNMLQDYKMEKRLPLKEDPLIWWKNNRFKYTILLPLVRQFLQVPASSVCKQMEEAISYVKLHRIHDANSMKLLFLKCNLPLLNFDY